MKKRNGQVLILVLLVVVVALAVGLSVASRNITNLRTSTQSEQSQRAFSAAEGGVESVITNPAVGTTTVPVGNLNATVVVSSSPTYVSTIEEGNVGQVDLLGPPLASGQVQIEWAKSGDPQEDSDIGGIPASIEITIIRGSAGNYTQERFAWSGISHGTDETFSNPVLSCTSTDFKKCGKIDVGSSPVLLRIRPFWNRATIKVTGNLPNQTFQVTSTATTELGVTRKIQVDKTALPQLPAAFDYVLYSEGNIEK